MKDKTREQIIYILVDEDFNSINVDPDTINQRMFDETCRYIKSYIDQNFSDILSTAYDCALDLESTIAYTIAYQKPIPRIFQNNTTLNDTIAFKVILAFEEDKWDNNSEVDWGDDVLEISLKSKVNDTIDYTYVELTLTNREWLAIFRSLD